MMLEASLIEYVVVHELAHLKVKNHSADFWRLVASVLPDAEDRRRRLREAGKTLFTVKPIPWVCLKGWLTHRR